MGREERKDSLGLVVGPQHYFTATPFIVPISIHTKIKWDDTSLGHPFAWLDGSSFGKVRRVGTDPPTQLVLTHPAGYLGWMRVKRSWSHKYRSGQVWSILKKMGQMGAISTCGLLFQADPFAPKEGKTFTWPLSNQRKLTCIPTVAYVSKIVRKS